LVGQKKAYPNLTDVLLQTISSSFPAAYKSAIRYLNVILVLYKYFVQEYLTATLQAVNDATAISHNPQSHSGHTNHAGRAQKLVDQGYSFHALQIHQQ
jgi:hypothetical protein